MILFSPDPLIFIQPFVTLWAEDLYSTFYQLQLSVIFLDNFSLSSRFQQCLSNNLDDINLKIHGLYDFNQEKWLLA